MGPRLIWREDEDVSAAIQRDPRGGGHRVRLDAECIARRSGTATDVGVARRLRATASPRSSARTCCSPWAAARTPTISASSAPASRRDERGYIVVDDELRTNVPGIWALGDCNGRGAFTHTAYNDFEIVAANLLDGDSPARQRSHPRVRAVHRPAARTRRHDRDRGPEAGRRLLVGKRPMTRVARAVEKGETQGFMKVVVDAESKAILGAAILGVGGDEVIHSILDVMYAKRPYTVIQRAMHIHPTVSELVPTLLGELEPA